MEQPKTYSAFCDAYLEYREGLSDSPPSLDNLSDEDRDEAQRWLRSLEEARGMDPFASPPSLAEVRARAREILNKEDSFEEVLESGLRQRLDASVWVDADHASKSNGLSSEFVVHARGIRLRAINCGDVVSDEQFLDWLKDAAAVLGAFPDTDAVLLVAGGPNFVGTIVNRYDVSSAFETPSGELGPPRILHAPGDVVLVCAEYVNAAVPHFEPFSYVPSLVTDDVGILGELKKSVSCAVREVVVQGSKARIPEKRMEWGRFGEGEERGIVGVVEAVMKDELEPAAIQAALAKLEDSEAA